MKFFEKWCIILWVIMCITSPFWLMVVVFCHKAAQQAEASSISLASKKNVEPKVIIDRPAEHAGWNTLGTRQIRVTRYVDPDTGNLIYLTDVFSTTSEGTSTAVQVCPPVTKEKE